MSFRTQALCILCSFFLSVLWLPDGCFMSICLAFPELISKVETKEAWKDFFTRLPTPSFTSEEMPSPGPPVYTPFLLGAEVSHAHPLTAGILWTRLPCSVAGFERSWCTHLVKGSYFSKPSLPGALLLPAWALSGFCKDEERNSCWGGDSLFCYPPRWNHLS